MLRTAHRKWFLKKKLWGKEVILNALHISFKKTSPSRPWFLSTQTLQAENKMTDPNRKFAEEVASVQKLFARNETRRKYLAAEEENVLLEAKNMSLEEDNMTLEEGTVSREEQKVNERLEGCVKAALADKRELDEREADLNERRAKLSERRARLNERETNLSIRKQELPKKKEVVTELMRRFIRPSDAEAPLREPEAREAQVDEADALISRLEGLTRISRETVSKTPRAETEVAPALPELAINADSVGDPWQAPSSLPGEAEAPTEPSPEAQEVSAAPVIPKGASGKESRASVPLAPARPQAPTWSGVLTRARRPILYGVAIIGSSAVTISAFLFPELLPSGLPGRQFFESEKQRMLEQNRQENEVEKQDDLPR